MNSRKEDCNHPARSRIDLKNGDGFHCDECGANIKVVPLGSEPKSAAATGAIIKSEPANLAGSPDPSIIVPGFDETRAAGLLGRMDDAGVVTVAKGATKLTDLALAELRVRFDENGKIKGYETCTTWAALLEKLGIPERTARYRMAKAGIANPAKKHDGSKNRKAKAQPALPPSPTAPTETLTATFYVVRRKSDGMFRIGNQKWEWTENVEYAAKGEVPKDLKVKDADHELVKVEAAYTLTPVAAPEPEMEKPTEPLRLPPRGGRRLQKRSPYGVHTYSSTHALLNRTMTFCGIYHSDDPKAQFHGTCKIVCESPKCPWCKWELEKRAKLSIISRGQKHERQ